VERPLRKCSSISLTGGVVGSHRAGRRSEPADHQHDGQGQGPCAFREIPDDLLHVNCGRCGQSLVVRIQEVRHLRTINCHRCETTAAGDARSDQGVGHVVQSTTAPGSERSSAAQILNVVVVREQMPCEARPGPGVIWVDDTYYASARSSVRFASRFCSFGRKGGARDGSP
jgi:hypothetical protein